MQNNVIVQPMSPVTGFIKSQMIIDGEEQRYNSFSVSNMQNIDRSFSIFQKIYQVSVLVSLACIHIILLVLIYKIYTTWRMPLPISLAMCWTLWSIAGLFVAFVLLKCVVGSVVAGQAYPINSWRYLHKLWLRQLIVSSFHHVFSLPMSYDSIWPILLRWLGADIENDVKLGEISPFLSYPTNLLKLKRGVTSFGSALLVPAEITMLGNFRVDIIEVGAHANLGNGCSLLPGSCLASENMIGNLTRVSREANTHRGAVLIGVPARVMPFKIPSPKNTTDQIKLIPFWITCLSHALSKYLLLSVYSFGGLFGGSLLHTIIIWAAFRWDSYIHIDAVRYMLSQLKEDHRIFITPFIGNTQWLVRLFRILGADIGNGVVLPEFSCLTDYRLITIGDHVRLNAHANIQVSRSMHGLV